MKKVYHCFLRSVTVTLFLLAMVVAGYAQQRVVTGTVSDATGIGLPGVNVIKKGTTIGTATDGNGNFSIEATDEDILVVSFIGYNTEEVKVGTQTSIKVTLIEDISTLEEVVVVGYGEMRKADLSSAQTSIGSELIQQTVNTTIEQAIQGRSAGVYVTQSSGQPGGGISVNIRGVSSITGTTEPLYVIDGVQIQPGNVSFGVSSSSNPLAGINPTDIESIDILQGPNATAIYGSRGTNGVIIITTKRGKAGATQVNYGFQYNLQAPPKALDVMNLPQYAQYVKEYHDIEGGNTPEEFLDPSILGTGTDWQDELFNAAPMIKHQLSLSGGSDKTTFYMSGEYLTQEGVAEGSTFDRYSFRVNLDHKALDWLKFGSNLNFSQTSENLVTSQENLIALGLRLTPQIPVTNVDGSWGGADDTNGANQFAPVNPIALANITTNELIRRQFLGGLNVDINLAKGLVFRTSFNTNLGFTNSTYFLPQYRFGYNENPTSRLEERSNLNTQWLWTQLLEYKRSFGKHEIIVMASHEAQESTWKNLYASRTGFVVDDVIDLGLGDANNDENGGGQGDWAMESYFGRINYNFDNRYIFSGAIRTDGSVNFGADKRWGVFPSMALAWRISEESFFNLPLVNDLKLRLETGVTGSQGNGQGVYAPLAASATVWGSGFLPTKYSNPSLQWEETLTNNIGVNVGLLDNRLQVEFDYYVKDTKNLLLDNPLPWYMGTNGQGAVAAPTVNIGALQTKGWGLTLNAIIIDKGGFTWNSNINVSAYRTKIKSFYSDRAQINRTSWWLENWTQRSVVGQDPWMFLGYIEDGIFQSIEEIQNSALPVDNNGDELPIQEENGVWVGDVKFKDISGPDGVPDGIIDVNDQTFIGNPWPKSFWGFTNTFSYKNFQLTILLTATQGNNIYNFLAKSNSHPNNVNLSRNFMIGALDYARVSLNEEGDPVIENPDTNVPRLNDGPNGNYSRHTDRWVEDGSFVRIKNVSLTYNLPTSLLSKQNIVRAARVTLGAQNLATITGYSGYDPEVGAYVGRDVSATNQAVGLDYGRYPLTPVYTFTVGVDF